MAKCQSRSMKWFSSQVNVCGGNIRKLGRERKSETRWKEQKRDVRARSACLSSSVFSPHISPFLCNHSTSAHPLVLFLLSHHCRSIHVSSCHPIPTWAWPFIFILTSCSFAQHICSTTFFCPINYREQEQNIMNPQQHCSVGHWFRTPIKD